MAKNLFALIGCICLVFNEVKADESNCTKVFKYLPKYYTASMEINIIEFEESKSNFTIIFEEAVDEENMAAKIVETSGTSKGMIIIQRL